MVNAVKLIAQRFPEVGAATVLKLTGASFVIEAWGVGGVDAAHSMFGPTTEGSVESGVSRHRSCK
jgi:hypothetical protein